MIDFTEIIGHEDIIRHFKSSIEPVSYTHLTLPTKLEV